MLANNPHSTALWRGAFRQLYLLEPQAAEHPCLQRIPSGIDRQHFANSYKSPEPWALETIIHADKTFSPMPMLLAPNS